jgi:hypothetical protein
MDFVYVLLLGSEWEDIVIFISKEDAIQESIKRPTRRVEIFNKTDKGYHPTYTYYNNGEYFVNP